MNYQLVVLTHAAGWSTLRPTLEAFAEMAIPEPSDFLIVVDGPEFGYAAEATDGIFEHAQTAVYPSRDRLGFCGATRRAWELAASDPGPAFVFYLEHDFELVRPLDLGELADVLDADPWLAQMALMRDAANEQETAAGGLYESRPGQYFPMGGWLRHNSYFTTNPSLMRRSFMRDHPWPAYPSECEGRFGLDLLAAGFTFGAWGTGEPWCSHVGVRTGAGY